MSRKKLLSVVLASLSALSCSAEAGMVRSKSLGPGVRNSSRLNDFSMKASGNTSRKARVNSTNFRANRNKIGRFLDADRSVAMPYTGLSKSQEKNAMRKLEEMNVSRSNSKSNIKKIVGILGTLGIATPIAIVLAVKYCGSSSLDWNNDKEKIIKFITWAKSSCRDDSSLNMFLNPIFLEKVSEIPVKDWNKAKLESEKEDASGGKKEELDLKLNLIKKVDIIQKIWDDCGNHNYISKDAQGGIGWEISWADFAKYSPETFGNFTSISANSENTKNPLLISGSLVMFGQNYLSDTPGQYTINGKKYFVGGAVLYFANVSDNGGHAIYVHLLYDDKNKIKRVIIQDPRSDNNENKSKYATQMKPNKNLTNLLNGEKLLLFNGAQKLYVLSAIMIREDKFKESNYWKDKSLPFKLNASALF